MNSALLSQAWVLARSVLRELADLQPVLGTMSSWPACLLACLLACLGLRVVVW
jgi:hypothetical protein